MVTLPKESSTMEELTSSAAKLIDAKLLWDSDFCFSISEPYNPKSLLVLPSFDTQNLFSADYLLNPLLPGWRLYFDPKKYPVGPAGIESLLSAIASHFNKLGYYGPNLGKQEAKVVDDDELEYFEKTSTYESVVNWSCSDLKLVVPDLCLDLVDPTEDTVSATGNTFGGTAHYSEHFAVCPKLRYSSI
jgi:hypothetical protein